jgi:hypothetical protein
MATDENSYPNPGNYPAPSFRRPIPLPDIPPDEGDLIYVGYNPAWTPALMGAVEQLMLPSTWQGDHETVIDALNEASVLQWLLTEPVTVSEIPTPFWDTETSADDQQSPELQPWYGVFADDEFSPQIEDWVIAGFIAATGEVGGAIWFLTVAPKFRLAWKKHDLGGIIRIFIDGADAGTVDTFSEEPGILQKTFIGDPEAEEHEIMMVLEELPEVEPFSALDAEDLNLPMMAVRSRLVPWEGVFPAFRYNPDTGKIEVTNDGTTWRVDEGADPRYNTAYQYDMTGKNRCGVAAGVVAQIDKWAETAAASAALVTLQNALFGNALQIIPVTDALADLYAYVAALVEDIGVEVVREAFDEDALRQIKCILLTCLGNDSAFTAAELAQAKLGVLQEFGDTVVSQCFDLLAESWGQVGFTNAGWVNYDPEADCECDECPIAYVDSLAAGIGWRTIPMPEAPDAPPTWQATGGRTGGGVLKSNTLQAHVRVDLGQNCNITAYSVWHRRLSAASSYLGVYVRVYNEAGGLVYAGTLRNGTGGNSNWVQDWRLGYLATGRYIDWIWQTTSPGVGFYIDDIEVFTEV